MSESDSTSSGIISSLRRVLDSTLEIASDRIELFGVELREEQYRLVEAILLAATLVAVGMLTLTLLTLLVVIYFWETARIPAVVILMVVYIGAGVMIWRRLSYRLKSAAPFSGTLSELKKDRECLGIKD